VLPPYSLMCQTRILLHLAATETPKSVIFNSSMTVAPTTHTKLFA